MIPFSSCFVGNPLTKNQSSDPQGWLRGTYAEKLNFWGDLEGRFLYCSEEALQTHFQGILWLVISIFLKWRLSKSQTWTSLSWRHPRIWTVHLVKLHLLKEFEVAIWRVGVSGGMSETLAFWALGSQHDCFSCFWESAEGTGLQSWMCSWVWSCVQWLVGLYMALVTFPLQTSPLAWCGLRSFCLYPNHGALKAYMF